MQTDSSIARLNMVRNQLAPMGVLDEEILMHISQTEKEDFFPAHLMPLLYTDAMLYHENGVILQNHVLALALQYSGISKNSNVLLYNCYDGYAAYISSLLCDNVECFYSDKITTFNRPANFNVVEKLERKYDVILSLSRFDEDLKDIAHFLRKTSSRLIFLKQKSDFLAKLVMLTSHHQDGSVFEDEILDIPYVISKNISSHII